MSHTPTPWFVTGSYPTSKYIDARIGGGRIQEVAHLMGCEVGDLQDNADRICACVNACEGLTNEQLNSGILQEFIANLKGK